MSERSPWWMRAAIALVTIVLALVARLEYDVTRTTDRESGEWVSLEADSFYHMRRLERLASEGLPVAGFDERLDYPDGAEIPWPPYYTMVLGALSVPWLSDVATERSLQIEQFSASVTVLFGVLSALLAAWSARRLAGERAAAFAGPCAALALCAVVYSNLGNGDHHAFVACLHAALLAAFTWGLATDALSSRARALRLGIGMGVLAGLGLGSWVAFLPYIAFVDLCLAALLFAHAKQSIEGLASFGLGFHLSALATISFAVFTSPWLNVDAWMVINLSYFHLFFLALGAAVFVPLGFGRYMEANRKRYPWMVFVALLLIGGVLLASGVGPGRGLREAFSWASGEDEFMASIQESRSFFDSMGEGSRQLLISLGWGVALLPFAWGAALVAFLRGRMALLPWVVATPLLFLQALSQLRFAEALVVPMAVLLAWAAARVLEGLAARGVAARFGAVGICLGAGVLVQQPALAQVLDYRANKSKAFEPTEIQAATGAARRMCNWLREAPIAQGQEAVLATWGMGHMIEWVADRPTVATNFGSYLGEDSYRFPARALLTETESELEGLLEERQVGHLVLTSDTTENLPDMIARADGELAADYLGGRPGGWRGALKPRWFNTSMARLLLSGSTLQTEGSAAGAVPAHPEGPIDFLRLVHVSLDQDPTPALAGLVSASARGWIWERVPGARLVAKGEAGEELRVRFEINFAKAKFRLTYEDSALVDSNGQATLRIPYATVGTNGDGRALAGASYRIGSKRGALTIDEQSVLAGGLIELP